MKFILMKTEDANKETPICSNSGDNLLTENAKCIIKRVFGENSSVQDFDFDTKTETIIENLKDTSAIFWSTFTFKIDDKKKAIFSIKNPDILKKSEVPVIPITSCIKVSPKDIKILNEIKLSSDVKKYVKQVISLFGRFPVRDNISKFIFENNGIKEIELVGDLGLFNFCEPVKEMKSPKEIKKIILTIGHYEIYQNEQLPDLAKYIRAKFPKAEIVYSTHKYNDKNFDFLAENNIKVKDTSVFCEKLDFYKDFDLHIGYRLHGHIKALSVGVPSILISEDTRSFGQKWVLNNIGIFNAFNMCSEKNYPKQKEQIKYNIFERIFSVKNLYDEISKRKLVTIFGIKFKLKRKFFASTINNIVKPSTALINGISEFIDFCLMTKFSQYAIIPYTINNLYSNHLIPYMKTVEEVITEKS